jgi:hypothetical protein
VACQLPCRPDAAKTHADYDNSLFHSSARNSLWFINF